MKTKYVYLIFQGRVDVVSYHRDFRVASLCSGSYFGEYSAIFKH